MSKKIVRVIFLLLIGILIGYYLHFFQHIPTKIHTEETTIYHTYLEKYVKRNGIVNRTFQKNAPLSIIPLRIEHHKPYDFQYHCYETETWFMQFEISNLSTKSYHIISPPELDYLIDNVWYECSSYGYTSLRAEGEPEYTFAPEETITITIPIQEPICIDKELPLRSGRFWYGHYRLVIEYAEETFTYVEFDLPETADYFSNRLYEN